MKSTPSKETIDPEEELSKLQQQLDELYERVTIVSNSLSPRTESDDYAREVMEMTRKFFIKCCSNYYRSTLIY